MSVKPEENGRFQGRKIRAPGPPKKIMGETLPVRIILLIFPGESYGPRGPKKY